MKEARFFQTDVSKRKDTAEHSSSSNSDGAASLNRETENERSTPLEGDDIPSLIQSVRKLLKAYQYLDSTTYTNMSLKGMSADQLTSLAAFGAMPESWRTNISAEFDAKNPQSKNRRSSQAATDAREQKAREYEERRTVHALKEIENMLTEILLNKLRSGIK